MGSKIIIKIKHYLFYGNCPLFGSQYPTKIWFFNTAIFLSTAIWIPDKLVRFSSHFAKNRPNMNKYPQTGNCIVWIMNVSRFLPIPTTSLRYLWYPPVNPRASELWACLDWATKLWHWSLRILEPPWMSHQKLRRHKSMKSRSSPCSSISKVRHLQFRRNIWRSLVQWGPE